MVYSCSNQHMRRAQEKKDDEYYTTSKTVERMLSLIDTSVLEGKVVWCPFNCANGQESEFVKYFRTMEQEGKIGELIVTGYNFFDKIDELKRADYVIDNPPFSIQNKIISLLERYDIDYYLIVGDNPQTIRHAIKENISLLDFKQKYINGDKETFVNSKLICNFESLDRHKKKLDPTKPINNPYPIWADVHNIHPSNAAYLVSRGTSFIYNFNEYYYPVGLLRGLKDVENSRFDRILWLHPIEREREQYWIDYCCNKYELYFCDFEGHYNKKYVRSLFEF